MGKNFKELQAKMSPESRARSEGKARQMTEPSPPPIYMRISMTDPDAGIREMALDELRAARDLTQEHLAKVLGVKQSAVSKLERRTDMYISTLRDFIKAMGGSLEIRAVFPDGDVRITQFRELAKSA